jgi:hypothetical protein
MQIKPITEKPGAILRALFALGQLCFLYLLIEAFAGPGASAQTRVLVLGSAEPYQSNEAAFPPAAVASSLQGILSGDAAISQPVTR